METEVREIIDLYLITCDKGVVALCTEKEKKDYLALCEQKNIKVDIKKITTNTTRANQIGNSIFKVNYPYTNKEELINFRNSVIDEWMKKCAAIKNSNTKIIWSKIAAKYNTQTATPEEFSQTIFDKIEFQCK
jgi:hypothetical protein